MPFETLKCSQCGAVPKEERTKFCGFCGALLPLQVPVPASPIEAPERFEAVLAHPDLPRLLERVPIDYGAPSIAPGVVLIVVMCGIAIAMMTQIADGGRNGSRRASSWFPASWRSSEWVSSGARSEIAPPRSIGTSR